MGAGASTTGLGVTGRRSSKECSTVWHEVANKDKYMNSDVLPDVDDIKVHVELLMMLDSPVGQRHLGDYAKLICTQETLFFWTDTLEFQAIPSTDYRRTKAHQLFRKYCLSGSVQALAFVKDSQREQMAALLEAARVDSQHALIEPDFFQPLRKACFLEILEQTYLRFKSDAARFSAYEAEASSTYNCVSVDDFDYMEKLGSGAFGRVVRVRKRTTQRHYAMKVQHKRALVHHYRDDPSRLHSEKAALATCSHPFILRMDYALQTPEHAMLVLNLVTTGTLQNAIDDSPEGRLPHSQVRFYAAEIVVALLHLHDLGLMHRDLKPRNVMLGEDGHVQLADMGGVGDFKGGLDSDAVVVSKRAREVPAHQRQSRKPSVKRRSVMGTKGYMAPEIVKLIGQSRQERDGYTRAVDWWGLGVTTYKMLTGRMPFTAPVQPRFAALRSRTSDYEVLMQAPDYPLYLEESAKAFCQKLLDVSPETRLGCGAEGAAQLKAHRFFNGINWEKLSEKMLPPPVVPQKEPLSEEPLYRNFHDMMACLDEDDAAENSGKAKDWSGEPTSEQQKLFKDWHYVSPLTLKVEMGIAKEMEMLDTNYKVQQLTGFSKEPSTRAALTSQTTSSHLLVMASERLSILLPSMRMVQHSSPNSSATHTGTSPSGHCRESSASIAPALHVSSHVSSHAVAAAAAAAPAAPAPAPQAHFSRALTNGRICLREPMLRCASEKVGSAGNDNIGTTEAPQLHQPDVLNGMKGKPQGLRVLNKQLSSVV